MSKLIKLNKIILLLNIFFIQIILASAKENTDIKTLQGNLQFINQELKERQNKMNELEKEVSDLEITKKTLSTALWTDEPKTTKEVNDQISDKAEIASNLKKEISKLLVDQAQIKTNIDKLQQPNLEQTQTTPPTQPAMMIDPPMTQTSTSTIPLTNDTKQQQTPTTQIKTPITSQEKYMTPIPPETQSAQMQQPSPSLAMPSPGTSSITNLTSQPPTTLSMSNVNQIPQTQVRASTMATQPVSIPNLPTAQSPNIQETQMSPNLSSTNTGFQPITPTPVQNPTSISLSTTPITQTSVEPFVNYQVTQQPATYTQPTILRVQPDLGRLENQKLRKAKQEIRDLTKLLSDEAKKLAKQVESKKIESANKNAKFIPTQLKSTNKDAKPQSPK